MGMEHTVEIRKDDERLRSHRAGDHLDALELIEGLRDSYASRGNVTWQFEEVNKDGDLFGMDPDGSVYHIKVDPPLPT